MSRLDEVATTIESHLHAIEELWKPGVKLTLLVRNPQYQNGGADVLFTTDDLPHVLFAIARRMTEAAQ